MNMPTAAVERSDAQRWREWQERGLAGDRRRAVAMNWVVALLAVMLGAMLGRLL